MYMVQVLNVKSAECVLGLVFGGQGLCPSMQPSPTADNRLQMKSHIGSCILSTSTVHTPEDMYDMYDLFNHAFYGFHFKGIM